MSKGKKLSYHMIKSTAYVEDSGNITVYGISCRGGGKSGESPENKSPEGGYPEIPDISTDADFVEVLIDRLNRHGADPVHLRDLIDDSLP